MEVSMNAAHKFIILSIFRTTTAQACYWNANYNHAPARFCNLYRQSMGDMFDCVAIRRVVDTPCNIIRKFLVLGKINTCIIRNRTQAAMIYFANKCILYLNFWNAFIGDAFHCCLYSICYKTTKTTKNEFVINVSWLNLHTYNLIKP